MEGKNRFTAKQINKALRLLRDLPVKDGRKSIRETLRLLEQGMRDALEKGYSRGEIRHTIAEAEILISGTTLKGFLPGEQKGAGKKQEAATVSESAKTGQNQDADSAKKTHSAGQKQDEAMAGDGRQNGRKEAEDMAEAGEKSVMELPSGREPPARETASHAPRARSEHDGKTDKEGQKISRKQQENVAGNVSPGSIYIKPDIPMEDL